MSLPSFSDPITESGLQSACNQLDEQHALLQEANISLQSVEEQYRLLLKEHSDATAAAKRRKVEIQTRIEVLKAYLAPVRRLPNDLLSLVFCHIFDEEPVAGWRLAAVCRSWRTLALSMPTLWSKMRLTVSPTRSAEVVRLWLSRSGSHIPLDIEINLRVPPAVTAYPFSAPTSGRRRSNAHSLTTNPATPLHALLHTQLQTLSSAAMTSLLSATSQLPPLLPGNITDMVADTTASLAPLTATPDETNLDGLDCANHWGHIALFYLVEQIHRWERFIFRFDKQFASITALKSIAGQASLLREFEVSTEDSLLIEPMWQWIPCLPSSSLIQLPNLRSVTLRRVPFLLSSALLQSNLQSLTLHSAAYTPSIDELFKALSLHPRLETLSIMFPSLQSQILPHVQNLGLSELRELRLSGSRMLIQLIEALIVPALQVLHLDIESPEPLDTVITTLLLRSSSPPLKVLAISYNKTNNGHSLASTWHNGSLTHVASWRFLSDLPLQSIYVGGGQSRQAAQIRDLLRLLSPPGGHDDDNHQGQPVNFMGPFGSAPAHMGVIVLPAWESPILQQGSPVVFGGGVAGPNAEGQNQNEWACPELQCLAIKGFSFNLHTVTTLVRIVEGRNIGTPGSSAAAATWTGSTLPSKLRKLEFCDCNGIPPDVLSWLKLHVDEVICQLSKGREGYM